MTFHTTSVRKKQGEGSAKQQIQAENCSCHAKMNSSGNKNFLQVLANITQVNNIVNKKAETILQEYQSETNQFSIVSEQKQLKHRKLQKEICVNQENVL